MKVLIKGIFSSFCAYPAIVFWVWIGTPIVFICSYAILVFSGINSITDLPLEYNFLMMTETKPLSLFGNLAQTLSFIQVYYSIRRYIKKCMTHAAPRASIKFKTYYSIIIYPIFINIISSFLLCFINPKSSSLFTIYPLSHVPTKYTAIYIIVYFLSYICELAIIYIYDRVYLIMEGDIRPNGWVADIFIWIAFFINFIALIEDTCFLTKSWLLMIAPLARVIWGLLSSLKRIIITLGVNGNKFIKIPENLL